MKSLKAMRLRNKLTLLFLAIGIIPVAVIGYLDFRRGCGILETQTLNQLISLREDRKAQLGTFFKHLRLDMEVLSDHRLLKDILVEYITAYNKGGIAGETFKAVDTRCHARCVDLCKKYGFEDMLFVNKEGQVLITIKKDADWGTNLKSGTYSDTNVAGCYKNAFTGISMVDFRPYPPSGKPAAFIGAPMISHAPRPGFEAEEMIGVLMIRIPVDRINAIMQRGAGLGDTGETYLTGKDMLMRSDSRFLKESTILKTKTESAGVRDAFEGRSGYEKEAVDYRGARVSVAYGPAETEGMHWAIVAKKDISEVVMPVLRLRNNTLTVGLVVAVAVFGAHFLFVAGIIAPIRRVTEGAHNIAAGDLTTRLEIRVRDEIGELADSFNRMARHLMESKAEIEVYSQSLEEKVEVRTAELEKKTEDLEKSNHVLAAYNDILTALNSELEIDPLMNEILGKIARRSDSQLGAIYLYENEEKKALLPAATYALDKGLIRAGFDLGKGLPGQAAAAKKSILVKDVPEDYFRISAGSFEGAPGNVICIPIMFRDQLMGVLELGVIRDFTDRNLEFLDVIVSQLGVGLRNALSYTQLKDLSADLQEKNELLSVQNEELQAQNEEIQAQSEELRSQAEELEAQKKQLDEKTRMAMEADRLKSEFLSNMSHELRTPLNALLGMTRLLSSGVPGKINKKQAEYLNVVERSGENLLRLMSDILDLSRIESGIMEIAMAEIPLKRFITDITGTVRSPAKEKNLTLTLDIEEDLSLFSDPEKLTQIMTNLLGNAVKFTEQGEVCISAKEEQGKEHDFVVISVRDTGIGIPEEAVSYLFDPFRQVDGSIIRKYGGTGLGLNICKKLAKLLNAKIDVVSEPGKGSTFTVTIPKDRRSKSRPKEEEWQKKVKDTLLTGVEVQPKEAYPKDRAVKDRAKKDILIVDDDPIVLRELKIILKDENCRLRVAFSGLDGLQRIKEQAPDLILLDLRMPGMDGFDMLEELKKNRDWKNIPVIILTAADLTESQKRELTENVKGVITKGQIDRQALLDRIREIIAEPGTGRVVELSPPARRGTGLRPGPWLGRADGSERGSGRVVEEVKREGPFKILIVEDEQDNMFYITETLRPSGYVIHTAMDGQEAVETARTKRPDLILMDVQIPVLSGEEARKQIKETEGLKGVPVIAMTARTMKGDREKMLAAGFDDYIGKPTHPNELINKVEEWRGKGGI